MSKHTGVVRAWTYIAVAMGLGLPGIILRVSGERLSPEIDALIFGMGIFGAAFLLSWAVEVAQLHISGSLAIAILALVAILPEYAIEAVLAWGAGGAWHAGANPADIPEVARVAANVTGSNRLIIGIGWSMVILLFWFKHRKKLVLDRGISPELAMLTVATLVNFLLFFMQEVALYVAGLLIVIYLFYLWVSSKEESEEPELMGPAATIGNFSHTPQLLAIFLLFAYSAIVIFAAAEPFVEGLVRTGGKFGIPEFTLIQWLAPLASESPELVIAGLFSLRGRPDTAMTTLVSSSVNQLTLLIGSMPFIFSLSFGHLSAFPLDHQQSVEFLLTASMSLFAIGLIARLRIAWYGALVLLGLFVAHLFRTDSDTRLIFAFLFLGLVALVFITDRGRILEMYHRVMSVPKIVRGVKEDASVVLPSG